MVTNSALATQILILSLVLVSISAVRYQTFVLHGTDGDSEKFTANFPNLKNVSQIIRRGKMSRRCVESGLWTNYLGENYGSLPDLSWEDKIEVEPEGVLKGQCGPKGKVKPKLGSKVKVPPIMSIRHVGNADMDSPGLSLYTDIEFSGSEVYFTGTSLRLPYVPPYPLLVKSYGLTGLANWTIFGEIDFRGSVTCLRREEGFTYEVVYSRFGPSYLVGSLRRGCPSAGSSRNPKNESEPSGLALFTEKGLQGHETFVSGEEGTELRLAIPQTIQSFNLSGRAAWRVWAGIDMDGDSKCLVPKGEARTEDESGERLYKALNGTLTMVVGSLRHGCGVSERETVLYTAGGGRVGLSWSLWIICVWQEYFYFGTSE